MKIRPATMSDAKTFFGEGKKFPTMKAWVGEVDGKIEVFAGYMLRGGQWFAFCDITDKGRPYKFPIARQSFKSIKQMRDMGVSYIQAVINKDEPRAAEWMTALGFRKDQSRAGYYVWRAK